MMIKSYFQSPTALMQKCISFRATEKHCGQKKTTDHILGFHDAVTKLCLTSIIFMQHSSKQGNRRTW